MKAYFRQPVLIAFAVFSLLLLFHFTQSTREKPASQSVTESQLVSEAPLRVSKDSPGSPVRLVIPAINVNANIQSVGVNTRGEMEVPSNTVDVGWFNLGPRPGIKGSAVISGHFNGKNGETGVFANLDKLKEGDKFYIEDDKGAIISFVVRESRTYSPGYAEEVFSRNQGAYLNLITCDGVWNGAKKSYSKRLVVFSDAIQP